MSDRGMDQEEVLTGEQAVMWNREEGRKGNGEMEVEVQGSVKGCLESAATVLQSARSRVADLTRCRISTIK